MIILAIADREPTRSILEILKEQPIDLVCTLGDLDQFCLRELEQITDIPKIGVYGNHCSGTYFEPLGIKNMHLQTFEYKGLTFGWFEGCVRYKQSSYAKMYTQEEATELLKGFPKVDVMLSHCPPYGINDEPGDNAHEWFKALKEYLRENNPKYFLHGHTYPTVDNIATKYHATSIIYVFQEKIIELK